MSIQHITNPADSSASGVLFVVATPIGNLGDISQRAQEVLAAVDLVAAEDTRHSRKLLSHFGINRPLLSLHEHNEDERKAMLVGKLQQGLSIALVSDAGTPLISDPGYALVQACREAGIAVTPVPGACALVAALSVSGLATDNFRFCGFPPRQAKRRQAFFMEWLHETATLVFYESSHRILSCLQDVQAVFGDRREIAVARELTKLYETVYTGSSSQILEILGEDDNQRKGEFVIMISGDTEVRKTSAVDTQHVLGILLKELPVKQAATLAAKITGEKKNGLYQLALKMKSGF